MADERYPSDWDIIAKFIKDEATWDCENCHHHHDPGHGYMLTVHHIDCNPANCERYNLVALCQRCHLHYQHYQNIRQYSFFGRPAWLQRYFDALQSKSVRLKQPSHDKLPVRPLAGSSC